MCVWTLGGMGGIMVRLWASVARQSLALFVMISCLLFVISVVTLDS